jgi:hypothetical protein
MSRVEAAPHLYFAIEALDINAEYARNSGDSIVGETDDQFSRAIALSLPDPRGADAIAEAALKRIEPMWILLVVACQVF